jgi:segregation and condensation protein B
MSENDPNKPNEEVETDENETVEAQEAEQLENTSNAAEQDADMAAMNESAEPSDSAEVEQSAESEVNAVADDTASTAAVDDAEDEGIEPTESEQLQSEPAAEDGSEAASDADSSNSDEVDSESESEAENREPVNIPNLAQIIEGAVLAADKPLSIDHIIQLFPEQEPSRAQVREAISEIQANCEGRGFEFKEVASGYRFQVRAEYGDWIGRLWEEKPPRYTRALLETLALIAYKQPITRGDIEEIRGVSVSTNIIRTLLEREWIRVVGHRDVPGRPSIYATTKTFLDYFNLTSLDELPTLSEIKDLDKVNAELDLEGELIEPRTLTLEDGDQEVIDTAADDEALDDVTDKVNEISENIKNLFRTPEEDDDFLDDEDDADAGDAAVAAPSSEEQTESDNEAQEGDAENSLAADEPADDSAASLDATTDNTVADHQEIPEVSEDAAGDGTGDEGAASDEDNRKPE